MSVFSQLKLWENSRCIMYHRKEGAMKIKRQFLLITGIKTNMLLFIFLGLIAKLASVPSECEEGNFKLVDFYWTKVGISVRARFL